MAAALWDLFENQKVKGLIVAMRQTLLKLEKAGHVDARWFNAMGEVCLLERNFTVAARYFKNALDEKETPAHVLNLGNALFYSGDIPGAKKVLAAHVEKYPQDAHGLANLADCHLQLGELREAKAVCEKGLEEKKIAHAPLHNTLGQVAYMEGDFAKAYEEFNLAYVQSPDYIDALFNRANMAYHLDRKDEAFRDFAQCLRKDENFVPAALNMALIHLEKGEWGKGKDRIAYALRLQPKSVEARHLLGRIHLAAKEFRPARDAFRDALKLDPEHLASQIALARLHVQEAEVDEALLILKKVLRRTLSPEERLAALSLLIELGEHGLCVAILEKNPEGMTSELRKILILGLWRGGRTKEAIQHLEKVLKDQGETPETLTMLARMLAQSGAGPLAEARLRRALELDPSAQVAAFDLARLYLEGGEEDKALSLLEASLSHHPDDPDCLYNLACCHARRRNLDDSLHFLKESLEHGFQDLDKINSDKDLDYIRQLKEFQVIAGQSGII